MNEDSQSQRMLPGTCFHFHQGAATPYWSPHWRLNWISLLSVALSLTVPSAFGPTLTRALCPQPHIFSLKGQHQILWVLPKGTKFPQIKSCLSCKYELLFCTGSVSYYMNRISISASSYRGYFPSRGWEWG